MRAIARRESPTKEYVNVICACWAADGRIEPLKLQRESDGGIVFIERVLDVRRAASLRAGGQGTRYMCRVINDQTGVVDELALYHDGDYWFIEKPETGEDVVQC